MKDGWGYIHLQGVGSLTDPEVRERVIREVRDHPKPWVHLQVLREDIDGQHEYPPEWAGNAYAEWLLKVVNREDCVDVTFDGWDFDRREVFQIPEIAKFCNSFLGRFQGKVPVKMEKGRTRNLPVTPKPDQERSILKRLFKDDPTQHTSKASSPRLRIFLCAETLQEFPLAFAIPNPKAPGNFLFLGCGDYAIGRILNQETDWPCPPDNGKEQWGRGRTVLRGRFIPKS